MNAPKPCLGGWCGRRNRCEHYHSADRRDPDERLCVPGVDGTLRSAVEPKPRATLAELIEEATAMGTA